MLGPAKKETRKDRVCSITVTLATTQLLAVKESVTLSFCAPINHPTTPSLHSLYTLRYSRL